MANASRKIGYIGLVHVCYTGGYERAFHDFSLYADWMSYINIFCIRYLPRSVGMRRIALHKSISARGDKMYLLVCECSDLLTEVSSAAVLIPTIRARLCGYTGLYRPIQVF